MEKHAQHPLVDSYLNYVIVSKGLAENSVASYSLDLHAFLEFLEERSFPLEQTDEQTLFLYLVHLRAHELGSRSIARHLSALRGFFSYAADEGALSKNPAQFLENPKIAKTLPMALTQEDIGRILEQPNLNEKLGFRDRAMLELLYAAGLRVSELVGLTPLDYDPQTGLLRVWGKGAKERITPIHPAAQEFMSAYLKTWRPAFHPQDDKAFLNRSGRGLTRQAVWKLVQRYAFMAGVRQHISPHTFRHSFASHLLEGGADLRTVQLLLGHEDISATEIYTHIQTGRLFEMHRTFHPRSRFLTANRLGTTHDHPS